MTDGGLLPQQHEVPSAIAPEPVVAQPTKAEFWTRRRVIVAVTIAILVPLGLCACAGYMVWRFAAAEFETMASMRPFVDSGYPDYRIIDSTRSGYILQHEQHDSLRLDVRFTAPKTLGVWAEAPMETLSPEWATVETCFRHAKGLPPDPRTKMNYDVDGFVEAYTPLLPGPDAVVSAVWLEGKDSAGLERYVVLVARRNRVGQYVEDMWPDHKAYFTRDPSTGEWTGSDFEPVEIRNPNE